MVDTTAPQFVDEVDSGAVLRSGLLANDETMENRMIGAYMSAYQSINTQLHDIYKAMDSAAAQGKTLKSSWIYEAQRLSNLEKTVRAELDKFAGKAYEITLDGQRDILNTTLQEIERISGQKIQGKPGKGKTGVEATFVGLKPEAVQNLVGRLDDGRPLRARHFNVTEDTWAKIQSTLVAGAVSGQNSDVIAAQISKISQIPLHRAVGLARTEMFGAQRDAALEDMRANSDLIQGWIWSADKTARTCAVCWGKHGSKHTLEESMRSHTSCRCTMLPWFHDDTEEDTAAYGNGEKDFRRDLTEAEQRRVLGPAKFDLWKKGAIKLADLIGEKNSSVWGKSLYEKSVTQLIAEGYALPTIIGKKGLPVAESAAHARNPKVPTNRKDYLSYYNLQAPFQPEWKPETTKKADTMVKGGWEISATNAKKTAGYLKNDPEMLELVRKVYHLPAHADDAVVIDYFGQHIRSLAEAWAGSSNGGEKQIRAQRAAREEFGLTNTIDVSDAYTVSSVMKKTQPGGSLHDTFQLDKKAVRAMWLRTQDEFKKKNLTHVTLGRGVGWGSYGGLEPQWSKEWNTTHDRFFIDATRSIDVELADLSSFSSDLPTAANFAAGKEAGYMLTTHVPVTQVISYGQTGFGTGSEHEFVMLGGPGELHVTPAKAFQRMGDSPTDGSGVSLSNPTLNITDAKAKQGAKSSGIGNSSAYTPYTPSPVVTASGATIMGKAGLTGLPQGFSDQKMATYKDETKHYAQVLPTWVTNSSNEIPAFTKNAQGMFTMTPDDLKAFPYKHMPIDMPYLDYLPVKINHDAYVYLTHELQKKHGTDFATWSKDAWLEYATYKVAAGFTVGSTIAPNLNAADLDMLNKGQGYLFVPKQSVPLVKQAPPAVTPPNMVNSTTTGVNKILLKDVSLTDIEATNLLTEWHDKYGQISPTFGVGLKSTAAQLEYWKIVGASSGAPYVPKNNVMVLTDLVQLGHITQADADLMKKGHYLFTGEIDASIASQAHQQTYGTPTVTPAATTPTTTTNAPPVYNGSVYDITPYPTDDMATLQKKKTNLDSLLYHGTVAQTVYDIINHKLDEYMKTAQANITPQQSGVAPTVAAATGTPLPQTPAPTATVPKTYKAEKHEIPNPVIDTGVTPPKKVVKIFPDDTVPDLQNKLQFLDLQLKYGQIKASSHKVYTSQINAAIKSGKHTAGGTVTPVAAPQPATTITPSVITPPPFTDLSELTYHAPKPGGAADGALFKDANGDTWLVKAYPKNAHAQNELLASKLYQLAGQSVPEIHIINVGNKWPGKGRVGLASRWLEEPVTPLDHTNKTHLDKARASFAVDAWLANWDTVGPKFDNMVIGKTTGTLHHVDAGGALLFGGLGGMKGTNFGNTVGEWSTLKNPSINPETAKIFGGISNQQMLDSAQLVVNLSDTDITAIVMEYAPGTDAQKLALAQQMIQRKNDIAQKAADLAAQTGIVLHPVQPAPPTLVQTPTLQPVAQAPTPTPNPTIAPQIKVSLDPVPGTNILWASMELAYNNQITKIKKAQAKGMTPSQETVVMAYKAHMDTLIAQGDKNGAHAFMEDYKAAVKAVFHGNDPAPLTVTTTFSAPTVTTVQPAPTPAPTTTPTVVPAAPITGVGVEFDFDPTITSFVPMYSKLALPETYKALSDIIKHYDVQNFPKEDWPVQFFLEKYQIIGASVDAQSFMNANNLAELDMLQKGGYLSKYEVEDIKSGDYTYTSGGSTFATVHKENVIYFGGVTLTPTAPSPIVSTPLPTNVKVSVDTDHPNVTPSYITKPTNQQELNDLINIHGTFIDSAHFFDGKFQIVIGNKAATLTNPADGLFPDAGLTPDTFDQIENFLEDIESNDLTSYVKEMDLSLPVYTDTGKVYVFDIQDVMSDGLNNGNMPVGYKYKDAYYIIHNDVTIIAEYLYGADTVNGKILDLDAIMAANGAPVAQAGISPVPQQTPPMQPTVTPVVNYAKPTVPGKISNPKDVQDWIADNGYGFLKASEVFDGDFYDYKSTFHPENVTNSGGPLEIVNQYPALKTAMLDFIQGDPNDYIGTHDVSVDVNSTFISGYKSLSADNVETYNDLSVTKEPSYILPFLVKYDNKYYIMQGDSKVAGLVTSGAQTFDALVFDLDYTLSTLPPPTPTTPQPIVAATPTTTQPIATLDPVSGVTAMWSTMQLAYENQIKKIIKAEAKGTDTTEALKYKAKMDSLIQQGAASGDMKPAYAFMADYKKAVSAVFHGNQPIPLGTPSNVTAGTTTPPQPTPPPAIVIAPYQGPGQTKPGGGSPPSDTVTVPKNKLLQSTVAETMAAIDKVHTVTGLSPLPVQMPNATELQKGETGKLKIQKGSGEVKYIMVDPAGSTPQYTMAHEYGHYIQHVTLTKHDTSQIYNAISKTATYKAIVNKATGADNDYFTYLSQGSEAFARAYAQYVAIKSGDPVLLAQLQKAQFSSLGLAWQTSEFLPIMEEFDKIFIAKGWMVP